MAKPPKKPPASVLKLIATASRNLARKHPPITPSPVIPEATLMDRIRRRKKG